ncbi:hypothetical protein [Pedococcus sp. 5OH_020]|uniref:hypothetical protein n=1 Tax=Pedococcus sp. 5OH_020 TaxID=2989814 RepID=UPI0022E9CF06|nr:hypothetical protein [Pedococcus sp. 5OH_020]
MTNSLGLFVQEQMSHFGWSRDMLAQRACLDEWTLEAILDAPVLAEWPDNQTILALARVFSVPVREVVLRSAEANGLHVTSALSTTETVLLASNDELIREMRRRLALGARMGGYPTSVAVQPWTAQSGTQSA